jgi:hypothetical protein
MAHSAANSDVKMPIAVTIGKSQQLPKNKL